MYLIDTNVISEARKKSRANRGVIEFFNRIASTGDPVYLSVITIGELRRGVELIRLRGDTEQAGLLEDWLCASNTRTRCSPSAPTPRRCGDGCEFRTPSTLWTSNLRPRH